MMAGKLAKRGMSRSLLLDEKQEIRNNKNVKDSQIGIKVWLLTE